MLASNPPSSMPVAIVRDDDDEAGGGGGEGCCNKLPSGGCLVSVSASLSTADSAFTPEVSFEAGVVQRTNQ